MIAQRLLRSPSFRCCVRWRSAVAPSGASDPTILRGGGGSASAHKIDNNPINATPDFSDVKYAFAHKSTPQLLRSVGVYQLCNLPFLLPYANTLLEACRAVLGNRFTDSLLRTSLFEQFCAGESEQDILPLMRHLDNYGVRGIVYYGVEADLPADTASSEEIEAASDVHLELFRSCIQSIHEASPNGFAALKVTALGNPKILQRVSTALVEARNIFRSLDKNDSGVLTREEFQQSYRLMFPGDNNDRLSSLLESLDPDMTGTVDYAAFCNLLTFRDLPTSSSFVLDDAVQLSVAEMDLMEALAERVCSLGSEAVRCGTRILVDAEQVRFQPAIDNLVVDLMQQCNKQEKPIIFNTYQCYRTDTPQRLRTDLARSERLSYNFGAKLVRGAYLESERALAKAKGYPSPLHETLADTHACYNDSVEYVMRRCSQNNNDNKNNVVELVCATHNQESIEKAIGLMNELGMDKRNGPVHFAQLLGMSDNLTFNLGAHGYQAYKCAPYGEVDKAVPYLLRRAEENSAIAGSATRELGLLMTEVSRRLFPNFSKPTI